MNCVFRDQNMMKRHDWLSSLAVDACFGVASRAIAGVVIGMRGATGYPVATSPSHKFIRVEVL